MKINKVISFSLGFVSLALLVFYVVFYSEIYRCLNGVKRTFEIGTISKLRGGEGNSVANADFVFKNENNSFTGSVMLKVEALNEKSAKIGDQYLVVLCAKNPQKYNAMLLRFPITDPLNFFQKTKIDTNKIKVKFLDL